MLNFEKYFRVKVNRVIDGDTLDVSFYLGLGIWLNDQRVRLLGINAPEMKGEQRPKGIMVKDYLVDAVNRSELVMVKTDEGAKGKYGRFLVILFLKINGKWVNANQELIKQGAAKEYMATDMSPAMTKEIFDPPPEDLESRLQVLERQTEDEVYDSTEEVTKELVSCVRAIIRVTGKYEE